MKNVIIYGTTLENDYVIKVNDKSAFFKMTENCSASNERELQKVLADLEADSTIKILNKKVTTMNFDNFKYKEYI